LFLSVIWHCLRHQGKVRSLQFFIPAFLFPMIFEIIGVSAGDHVYEGYFLYFGQVPIAIGLGWCFVFYTCMFISDGICNTKNRGRLSPLEASCKSYDLHGKSLMPSLIDALIAVSYDLFLDPVAVTFKWWIWFGKPIFMGVPLMNFVGWFLMVFLFSAVFRYVTKQRWSEQFRTLALLISIPILLSILTGLMYIIYILFT